MKNSLLSNKKHTETENGRVVYNIGKSFAIAKTSNIHSFPAKCKTSIFIHHKENT